MKHYLFLLVFFLVACSSDDEVGWKTDENPENGDMLFFGKTYLVHVISTYGGVPIDRYYPCSPQDLMWRYVSKHRVN